MPKGVETVKRLLIIMASMVILFLAIAPPVGATMMETLLPQDEEKKTEGKVLLEYNEYKLYRYSMDTKLEESEASDYLPWGWDDQFKKGMDQSLSQLNSTLWGLNRLFAYIIGIAVSES